MINRFTNGRQKTADKIKMMFGLWTRLGPRNPCIGWGPDPHMRKDNFEGKGWPIVKYLIWTLCRELCKNDCSEATEMSFGMWIRVGNVK